MSATYSTGSVADADALYVTIRGLLTGAGWTIIQTISDSVYNRHEIYRSAAFDPGALNYCYLRLRCTSSSILSAQTYTDWDASNTVGAHEGYSSAGQTVPASASTYFIRVNEWAIAIVLKYGSTFYKAYYGFIRRGLPPWRSGTTRLSADVSAGVSSLSVATSMVGKLQPNQKVIIYNHSENAVLPGWGHSEIATIDTVSAGTITLKGPIAYSYDAGAVIGWNPHPAVVMPMGSSDTGLATSYASLGRDGSWQSSTSQGLTCTPLIMATESYVDPDEISLEYQGGPVSVVASSTGKYGFYGYMFHFEAVSQAYIAKEDILSDGEFSYICVVSGATGWALLLGPIGPA